MAGARLDRRCILAPRARLDRDLAMRRLLRGGKSRRLNLSLDDEIAPGLGVNERRAIGECRARVDDGRGFGDVDQHAVGNIFGFRFARRHDCGDRFADKFDETGSQDRLRHWNVVELMQRRRDRLHRRKVGRREHNRVVGYRDFFDFARSNGAAHKSDPMDSRQIGGEAATTGEQSRVLQPAD